MLAESDIEMTLASNVTEKSSYDGILLICFIQYINKLNYLNTIGKNIHMLVQYINAALYIHIHNHKIFPFFLNLYFHPAIKAEVVGV